MKVFQNSESVNDVLDARGVKQSIVMLCSDHFSSLLKLSLCSYRPGFCGECFFAISVLFKNVCGKNIEQHDNIYYPTAQGRICNIFANLRSLEDHTRTSNSL